MSKVYNYMIMAVGITLLLKFAGIPSGADAFLSWLGLADTPSGVSLGTFFVGVAALFTAGLGAGIIIGSFTRTQTESYVVAPVAAGIFTVITSTFITIVNYTQDMGWVYYVVYMIFIPFLIAFGIAITEWWRGSG